MHKEELGDTHVRRDRERFEQRLGTIIDGRYRLDRLLGWGKTSAVYEATHRNGFRAALKILHASLRTNADACERLLYEASLANVVTHPAIVRVLDDGITEDGCLYLVLEHLDGQTLESFCARFGGYIDLEVLAPIADVLMSALTAIHECAIVHRSLEPRNVFLTSDGEVKFLGFCTAKSLHAGGPPTVRGTLHETPAFMSPEAARGAREEMGSWTDIWSLGAILFTALSGEHVHIASTESELSTASTGRARSLAAVMPDLDTEIIHVIDRALAFEKDARWPNVRMMHTAFTQAVAAARTRSARWHTLVSRAPVEIVPVEMTPVDTASIDQLKVPIMMTDPPPQTHRRKGHPSRRAQVLAVAAAVAAVIAATVTGRAMRASETRSASAAPPRERAALQAPPSAMPRTPSRR
ncbi:MAG: serine/threonine protein kinase [Polyangiaceae bacterium]|nr:serine/threonine protein kinase [Polyangiaceae bacterium]